MIRSKNILRGLIIYPLGDCIAQLILQDFHLTRIIVLALIGGFLYSFEIGTWFSFIERKISNPFYKTLLAVAFFNPIWIARHFLFIEFSMHPSKLVSFSESWSAIEIALQSATTSFLVSIFFTLIANFIIQNKISLKYRFMSSAVFSALMNVYYAISKVFF